MWVLYSAADKELCCTNCSREQKNMTSCNVKEKIIYHIIRKP
jgi:hypothetical protein